MVEAALSPREQEVLLKGGKINQIRSSCGRGTDAGGEKGA
jgi:hypothetical protein